MVLAGVRRLLVGDSACPGHQGMGGLRQSLLMLQSCSGQCTSTGDKQERLMSEPNPTCDGRIGLSQDSRTCPSPVSYSGCICQGQRGGLTGLGSDPVVGVRTQVCSMPADASPGSAGAARVAVV